MLIAVDEKDFKELIKQITELKEIICSREIADHQTDVLDSEQAAAYLKITERHLAKLKADKDITFSQYGKVVRYRRSDLDKWLEIHRIQKR